MRKSNILYFVVFAAVFILLPGCIVEVLAVEIEEPQIYAIHLDESTIAKGYTFVSPDGDFKIGVRDGAINTPVTVRFKRIPDSHMLSPLQKAPGEKASAIWEFDILADDNSAVKLLKPIYAAISITNEKMNRKIMYYFDKKLDIWRALPSSIDIENKIIRTMIYLPYARLALFDEPDGTTYEAYASWYPTELTRRNILGCASNVYLMNTPLWVCRLDNLDKCTISRVISVGPFIDNRVVDLTKAAFEEIGNPRGGVLGVRVFLRKE